MQSAGSQEDSARKPLTLRHDGRFVARQSDARDAVSTDCNRSRRRARSPSISRRRGKSAPNDARGASACVMAESRMGRWFLTDALFPQGACRRLSMARPLGFSIAML
jgi:hypothetical protein